MSATKVAPVHQVKNGVQNCTMVLCTPLILSGFMTSLFLSSEMSKFSVDRNGSVWIFLLDEKANCTLT